MLNMLSIQKKKLVYWLYMMGWGLCTLGMIFLESSIFSYIATALILSMLLFIDSKALVFNIFILSTVAWGANLNLGFRFGNIMMSDLALAVLCVLIVKRIIIDYNYQFNKKSFVFIMVAIWFCALGILLGNEIGNVLQDFKLFLYVFAPYVYLKSETIDDEFLSNVMLTLKFYVMTVFGMEVHNLVTVGLDTMVSNGFGQRDVAIIVQFVPLAATCFYVNKRNEAPVIYILFQSICFLACLFSFTRTVWIAYIVSYAVVLTMSGRNALKSLRNILYAVIVVFVALLAIKMTFPQVYNDYIGAVISRITDSTNSNNTVNHRYEQAIALFNTKVMRPLTLIGAGFGEITELKNSVFMENSILYYFWKYGLFPTLYFVFLIIKNTVLAIKTKNNTLIAAAVSLFVFCIVGNFSGNLNLYYCMPAISFIFAYPYMKEHYIINQDWQDNGDEIET